MRAEKSFHAGPDESGPASGAASSMTCSFRGSFEVKLSMRRYASGASDNKPLLLKLFELDEAAASVSAKARSRPNLGTLVLDLASFAALSDDADEPPGRRGLYRV